MEEENSFASACTCKSSVAVIYSCKHRVCNTCGEVSLRSSQAEKVSDGQCLQCSWMQNVAKDIVSLDSWQFVPPSEDQQSKEHNGQQQLLPQPPTKTESAASSLSPSTTNLLQDPLQLLKLEQSTNSQMADESSDSLQPVKWPVNENDQPESGQQQLSLPRPQRSPRLGLLPSQLVPYHNTSTSNNWPPPVPSLFSSQMHQPPPTNVIKQQALGPIGQRPPNPGSMTGPRFPVSGMPPSGFPLFPPPQQRPVGCIGDRPAAPVSPIRPPQPRAFALSHPECRPPSQPYSSDSPVPFQNQSRPHSTELHLPHPHTNGSALSDSASSASGISLPSPAAGFNCSVLPGNGHQQMQGVGVNSSALVRPRPIYSCKGLVNGSGQSAQGPVVNDPWNGTEANTNGGMIGLDHIDLNGHFERYSPLVDRPPSGDSSCSQESIPHGSFDSINSLDGKSFPYYLPSNGQGQFHHQNGYYHMPPPQQFNQVNGNGFHGNNQQFGRKGKNTYKNNGKNWGGRWRKGQGKGQGKGQVSDFDRTLKDKNQTLPPLPPKKKFTPGIQLCQQHEMPILMNCNTCKMGVCTNCYCPGAEHEHHSREYLDQEVQKQKNFIQEINKDMISFLHRMRILHVHTGEDLEDISNARESEADGIQDFFQECRAELERQERRQLCQLKLVADYKHHHMSKQHEELKDMLPKVQRMQTDLEACMANNDGIANSHQLVADILNMWESIRDLAQRHVSAQVQFVRNEALLLDMKRLVGISSGYDPLSCEIRGHCMSRTMIGKPENLSIALIDYQGKPYTSRANGLIEVTLSLPNGSTQDLGVHYIGHGCYSIRFHPDSIGTYGIQVKLNGQAIEGSSSAIHVYSPTFHVGHQKPIFHYDDTDLPMQFQLFKGWGMAVSKVHKRMYVTDRDNHTVWVFRFEETVVDGETILIPVADFCFGKFGGGEGQFNKPTGIDVHDDLGRVAVVDKDNHRMQMFDLSGRFLFQFGRPPKDDVEGGNGGILSYPWDVSFRKDGFLAVTNSRMSRVEIFTPEGTFHRMYPPEDRHSGVFQCPRGVCWDEAGCLYVTEFEKETLVVIRTDMRTHKVYHCSSDVNVYVKSDEKAQGFHRPQGIVVDPEGHVLVCDARNMRVLRFTPSSFEDVKRSSPPGQRRSPGGLNSEQSAYILRPATIYEPSNPRPMERVLNVCLSPAGDIITLHAVQEKQKLTRAEMKQKIVKIQKSKELSQKTLGIPVGAGHANTTNTIPQGQHECEKNHMLIFRP